MQPATTPYTDINQLLERFLSAIQKIIGEKLVGLYLFGSLVTGDFEKESSDIDLLAATSSDLDETEVEALQKLHHDIADEQKEWDDRIEVVYISVTALKTFRVRQSKIAIISPGEPFHVKEAGKDWLINWYVVREKGIALFGPSPTTLIDPISKEEFACAVQEYVKLWSEWVHHRLKRRPSQAYAILTMCRALYTLQNGEQVSKKQAALWAEKEFPQWAALIQNALVWRNAWRDGHVDHDATFPETLQFVRFAIRLCETNSDVPILDVRIAKSSNCFD